MAGENFFDQVQSRVDELRDAAASQAIQATIDTERAEVRRAEYQRVKALAEQNRPEFSERLGEEVRARVDAILPHLDRTKTNIFYIPGRQNQTVRGWKIDTRSEQHTETRTHMPPPVPSSPINDAPPSAYESFTTSRTYSTYSGVVLTEQGTIHDYTERTSGQPVIGKEFTTTDIAQITFEWYPPAVTLHTPIDCPCADCVSVHATGYATMDTNVGRWETRLLKLPLDPNPKPE